MPDPTPFDLVSDVENALNKAIELISQKLALASANDRLGLEVDKQALIGKVALVRAQKLSIIAMTVSLAPPTAAQFGEVKGIAAKLDAMVATAVATDELLASVTKLMKTFSELQPIVNQG